MSEQRIADARLAEIAAAVRREHHAAIVIGDEAIRIFELADLCADLADARANALHTHAAGQEGAVRPRGVSTPVPTPEDAAGALERFERWHRGELPYPSGETWMDDLAAVLALARRAASCTGGDDDCNCRGSLALDLDKGL